MLVVWFSIYFGFLFIFVFFPSFSLLFFFSFPPLFPSSTFWFKTPLFLAQNSLSLFFFLGFSWLTLILSPLLHSSSIYPHFSQLKLFFFFFLPLKLGIFSLVWLSLFFFFPPIFIGKYEAPRTFSE